MIKNQKLKFPSELRQDLISKDWVVIATGRSKKPKLFKREKRKKIKISKKICPFCNIETQEKPILIYSKGKIISQINKKNFSKIKKSLKGADKIDVTGGMLHKVTEAIKMAGGGIKVDIIGGKKGNLEKCLEGKKVGTQIKNF